MINIYSITNLMVTILCDECLYFCSQSLNGLTSQKKIIVFFMDGGDWRVHNFSASVRNRLSLWTSIAYTMDK